MIAEHRQQVYRESMARHPTCWSGEIKSWELPEKGWWNTAQEQSDLYQTTQVEATTMLANTENNKANIMMAKVVFTDRIILLLIFLVVLPGARAVAADEPIVYREPGTFRQVAPYEQVMAFDDVSRTYQIPRDCGDLLEASAASSSMGSAGDTMVDIRYQVDTLGICARYRRMEKSNLTPSHDYVSNIDYLNLPLWEVPYAFSCLGVMNGEGEEKCAQAAARQTVEFTDYFGNKRWSVLYAETCRLKNGVFAQSETSIGAPDRPPGSDFICVPAGSNEIGYGFRLTSVSFTDVNHDDYMDAIISVAEIGPQSGTGFGTFALTRYHAKDWFKILTSQDYPAGSGAESSNITVLSPIRFRGPVVSGTISRDQVEHLLDLTINIDIQHKEGLELVNGTTGEKERALTCRGYQKLRKEGFDATATLSENELKGSFVRVCDLLDLVKSAEAPAASHFPDVIVEWAKTDFLPGSLANNSVKRYCDNEQSLKQCADLNSLEVMWGGNTLYISSEITHAAYTPQLRADFNGDGWEDLLLLHRYFQKEGNTVWYETLCLEWPEKAEGPGLFECKTIGTDKRQESARNDSRNLTLLSSIEFKGPEISGSLSKDQIDRLFDLKVNMGRNSAQGVELGGVTAQTCREYVRLRGKGFFPETGYDIAMNSYFVETCGVLKGLKKAEPFRHSRFPESVNDWTVIETLPGSLAVNSKDSDCEQGQRLKECATLSNLNVTGEGGTLSIESDSSSTYYSPRLRADLNGDGWEDLLLYQSHYVKEGTFRIHDSVCLGWPGGAADPELFGCDM